MYVYTVKNPTGWGFRSLTEWGANFLSGSHNDSLVAPSCE